MCKTSHTYESFKSCIVNNQRVILREVSITRQDTLLHEIHRYTLYYKCIYTHVRASYVSIDSFESILKYNAHHKIHIYTLPWNTQLHLILQMHLHSRTCILCVTHSHTDRHTHALTHRLHPINVVTAHELWQLHTALWERESFTFIVHLMCKEWNL